MWHQKKSKGSIALLRRAAPLLSEVLRYPWATLIDFGCGYGLHCRELAKSGREVSGIDLGFLPEAHEDAKTGGYKLISGSWSDLDAESYDVGYSHHCLEHSRDPIGWLHDWARIIKRGGKLFLAVPQHYTRATAGHIAVGWSIAQVIYMLALAGWDCRQGRFSKQSNSILAIVDRPGNIDIAAPDTNGPWGIAAARLPEGLKFDGSHFTTDNRDLNWQGPIAP